MVNKSIILIKSQKWSILAVLIIQRDCFWAKMMNP
jgi:hypothetical protein